MSLFRQINLHKYNTISFVCRCCSLAGPSNLYCQEMPTLPASIFLWSCWIKSSSFIFIVFQEWMALSYAFWLLLSFMCYISSSNSLPGYMRGVIGSSEARWDFLISTLRKLLGHIGACSVISVTLFYCSVVGSFLKIR